MVRWVFESRIISWTPRSQQDLRARHHIVAQLTLAVPWPGPVLGVVLPIGGQARLQPFREAVCARLADQHDDAGTLPPDISTPLQFAGMATFPSPSTSSRTFSACIRTGTGPPAATSPFTRATARRIAPC